MQNNIERWTKVEINDSLTFNTFADEIDGYLNQICKENSYTLYKSERRDFIYSVCVENNKTGKIAIIKFPNAKHLKNAWFKRISIQPIDDVNGAVGNKYYDSLLNVIDIMKLATR